MTNDFTTHILERRYGTHEWGLYRDQSHRKRKLLTVITAVSAEMAMERASVWIKVHGDGRVGNRWVRSRGFSDRYALRTTWKPRL